MACFTLFEEKKEENIIIFCNKKDENKIFPFQQNQNPQIKEIEDFKFVVYYLDDVLTMKIIHTYIYKNIDFYFI